MMIKVTLVGFIEPNCCLHISSKVSKLVGPCLRSYVAPMFLNQVLYSCNTGHLKIRDSALNNFQK